MPIRRKTTNKQSLFRDVPKPNAIGLVPSAALAPPGGATMGGAATLAALVVAALVLALSRPLTRPLLGGEAEPVAPAGTAKVVLGDLMFGLGWGLAGYFPLAALVALGVFAPGAAIFLAAVLVGMILHDLVAKGGMPRGEGRFSRG